MNIRLKTYFAEAKRIFSIFFDTRDVEDVRKDYFSDKWISKEELNRLLIYEEEQFVVAYTKIQNDYRDLLNSFSMNSLANYELLERKMQGQLKK